MYCALVVGRVLHFPGERHVQLTSVIYWLRVYRTEYITNLSFYVQLCIYICICEHFFIYRNTLCIYITLMYLLYTRAGDQHVGAWCFRSPAVGTGAYVYPRISYLFENPSKCMSPAAATPHRNAMHSSWGVCWTLIALLLFSHPPSSIYLFVVIFATLLLIFFFNHFN